MYKLKEKQSRSYGSYHFIYYVYTQYTRYTNTVQREGRKTTRKVNHIQFSLKKSVCVRTHFFLRKRIMRRNVSVIELLITLWGQGKKVREVCLCVPSQSYCRYNTIHTSSHSLKGYHYIVMSQLSTLYSLCSCCVYICIGEFLV